MYKRRSVRTKGGKRTVYKRKLRTKAKRRKSNRTRSIKPEVKQNTGQYAFTSYNGVINSAGDFLNIVPEVTQGIGENQRVGSRINPLKIVVKGYIVYKADATYDAKMIQIRQFFMRPRSSNSNPTFSIGSPELHLIDFGGTSGTYNGTVAHHLAPHNNDMWRFYRDKKITMLRPYGAMNLGTNASATLSMQSVSPTMFRPFTFTVKAKQMPKQFLYDSHHSAGQPTNFSMYHAMGYTDMFNAAADVANTQIALAMNTTIYYTDP